MTERRNSSLSGKTGSQRHVGSEWVWIVMGPTATGKTTVATYLAEELGMTYIEGDDYHPQANIDKMSKGIPLNDEDRVAWLATLRDQCVAHLHAGNPDIAVTCSALERKYRDVLREASRRPVDVKVSLRFLYLAAPEEVLLKRAKERHGHFAGANLVHSQLEVLEPPGPEEKDMIIVDATPSMEEVKKEVLRIVKEEIRLDKQA